MLNLGTYNGQLLRRRLAEQTRSATPADRSAFSAVLNGRFTAAHITRAYGDPAHGMHAVQLELAQRGYMDEASREYLPTPRRASAPCCARCSRSR